MINDHLKYYFNRLQSENYKSFYLAFLRVGISWWLLKEVFINWPSMEILYGKSVFVEFKPTILNRLPGGISFVRNHYMWFIVAYVIITTMNLFGVGKWVTALLLFFSEYVLQKMNMSFGNSGDRMVRMILFYLIFADSYQFFVLIKQKNNDTEKRKLQNLVSNLAAFSIMLQLCLAYFLSGVAKINDPYWWHGEGVYYAMSLERFMGTPFNKYLVQYKWFDLISNYFTIAFEVFFPLLIWIKKCRKPLLITGVLFHLGIYIFMMIYGFQIVFVLMYGLFLRNDQLILFAQKIKLFFWRKKLLAVGLIEWKTVRKR